MQAMFEIFSNNRQFKPTVMNFEAFKQIPTKY
ncbi:hypothetical protein Emtol_3112 [Emticicia oligotrophica DSM 17448]|uniref:Uncharacterized protein n=1 Tax=Emticicia oligotrophica (strain DSM 17448 / CIP 109782 / MTCC 6937 / GPTSA100-15) TaxID=929562 RepID=A0ABM5N4A0_EMTOG|nr:hypothetical protein Emtol_3112 [Emticicia oligotrophica DSM 17448]